MTGILVQVPRRHPVGHDEQDSQNVRRENRIPIHLGKALNAAPVGSEDRVDDLAQAPHVLSEVLPVLCKAYRLETVLVVELEYPDIGQGRVRLDLAYVDEAPVVFHPKARVEFARHDRAGGRKLELVCRTLRNRGDQLSEYERGDG